MPAPAKATVVASTTVRLRLYEDGTLEVERSLDGGVEVVCAVDDPDALVEHAEAAARDFAELVPGARR